MSVISTGCSSPSILAGTPQIEFDSSRAYQDVIHQLSFGPRIPGSESHRAVVKWISQELQQAGWMVEQQTTQFRGQTVVNLIASRSKPGPYYLLGAHYDSRIYADQDPDQTLQNQPVPGANDGASGVAVLLELARVLPEDLRMPVKLVFFDAEDNGGIGEYDWILGSRAFVQETESLPDAAVIIDMIGDADLQIYYERNSNAAMRENIWKAAAAQGLSEYFIPQEKYSILDDHTPFLEAGIPAVDIIDFDYPYWHTTQDTADKVSPESLRIVGITLISWLTDNYNSR